MRLEKKEVLVFAFGLAMAAAYTFWEHIPDGLERTVTAGAAVQPEVPLVEAVAVEIRALDSTISAVGSLKAKESIALTAEIDGRIHQILFEEGQQVEAGTVLFRLDTSVLGASVQSAHAAHTLAQSTFERTQTLSKRGISTMQTLEEAQANLDTTEAALALAESQFNKASIKAPFSGVVGLRSVSVGAYITAGATNLANLDQIDPLVAEFTLPEIALADISTGQKISLATEAFPDQIFQGQIYAIEPSVDEIGRSIRMRALISNSDRKLRPGLFVRVTVITDTRTDAMLIPESAIVPNGETQSVYRINDDNIAELVTVTPGQRLDGLVEIVTGLDRNALVVTAGQQKLQSGSKVQIKEMPVEGAV